VNPGLWRTKGLKTSFGVREGVAFQESFSSKMISWIYSDRKFGIYGKQRKENNLLTMPRYAFDHVQCRDGPTPKNA
jgi:hypothetical protein